MPTLIDRNGPRPDAWVTAAGGPDTVPAGADVLVPLAQWRADADAWTRRAARIGVLLGPADDPASIAGDLGRLALVAVAFPSFVDGRGYSIARLLRERHGWRGELRAVGDVARDQLFLLARCGFDAFALRDGEDVAACTAAFADFGVRYQAAADEPLPLFRRRAAEAR
ncbi:MAG TPA: DUF934 domain-containing protein [Burkholderiaceae bacterium]|nr:DUF934 domain-containing protein [Burkholderiaceae bacterium]